jgi:hypothetical protein
MTAGPLTYVWTVTGGHGAFADGTTATQTTSPEVLYRCWSSDEEGMDTLTVEVLSETGDPLGSDEAEISVTEGRKTIVYGTGRGSGWARVADGWRESCVGFSTYTPKVHGAVLYEVYCYGFNDTAYWGTERRYAIDPATYPETNGEYEMGWSGGCGWGPYGGTEGESEAQLAADIAGMTGSWRWAGMIVEVTVHYAD